MKKTLYLALVCLVAAVMLTACKQNNNPERDGDWYTASTQINISDFDGNENKCWAIDIWCDGTTIGRDFEWGTEAQIALAAKTILAIDYQIYGYQTKKVKWFEADASDEDACGKLVWEGAVCWEETVGAGGQTETNYGWMPEANMKERHDYYESKGLTHTYVRADADNQDACEKLNGEEPADDPTVDEEACWQFTFTKDGASNTVYMWATKAAMDSYVKTYGQAGYTATYTKAEANDADACNLLNAGE